MKGQEQYMDHWETFWEKVVQNRQVNYTNELWTFLSSQMDLTGKRVLEVGGGAGGNASWLASQGADVYVLDYSPTALVVSRRTAEMQGVSLNLLCGDAKSLPLPDGFFDLIYHVGVLQLFHHPKPLILEQHRLLKDGGHLLIDVPQKYNLFTIWKHLLILLGRWQYGDWETEYDYGQLNRLFQQSGFITVGAYGRRYYPYPFYALRHFYKIEEKLLGGKRIVPSGWWRKYVSLWESFEKTKLSLYSLMNLGVLGRKIPEWDLESV